MTHNDERFRGVKCLHCKQPIEISPLVASIEADGSEPAQQGKRQIFRLRCPACGKEKPYMFSEIFELQISPGSSGAEPSSTFGNFGARSKAASG